MSSKAGYARILEAILVLMLLSTPFMLLRCLSSHNSMKVRGAIMNALVKADFRGDLTKYIYSGRWTEADNLILSLLPSDVKVLIIVEDGLGNILHSANYGLSNDSDIVVVSYILMFGGLIRIVKVKSSL